MSYAISFPDIFNKSTINLKKDYDAIRQDLVLLLASNKGGLYGDPWFGTRIKPVLWNQNHPDIMLDLIRDDIYESIYSYMSENVGIDLEKEDITITIVDTYVNVEINLSAYSNKENDMLNISLLNEGEA